MKQAMWPANAGDAGDFATEEQAVSQGLKVFSF